MDPIRGLIAGLCLFVGATLASLAIITASIGVVHAFVTHTPLAPSRAGAGDVLALVAFGVPLFVIGHMMAPRRLTAGGRTLVTAGLLWWLLSGSCYATLYADDKTGLAIVGAMVITSVSALLIGFGAARREADEA